MSTLICLAMLLGAIDESVADDGQPVVVDETAVDQPGGKIDGVEFFDDLEELFEDGHDQTTSDPSVVETHEAGLTNDVRDALALEDTAIQVPPAWLNRRRKASTIR